MSCFRFAAATLALLVLPLVGDASETTMTATRTVDRAVDHWHFYAGVPFARGALRDAERFALYRDGKLVPTQASAVATWGPDDDSIRWLAVDFVDALEAGAANQYTFAADNRAVSPPRVHVRDLRAYITVDNGRLKLRINKAARGFNLFDSVTLDGRDVWKPGANTGAYVVDGDGHIYRAALDRTAKVEVESVGPLAVVIRAEGWFVNPAIDAAQPEGEPHARPQGGFCRYITRLSIATDQPRVRVQHTFINTEDSSNTTWRDIGLSLPVAPNASAHFGGIEGDHIGPVHLLQKSFDAYAVHRDGDAQPITTGETADGWMRAGDVAVGVRDFRQNYPKELELLPEGEMRVHLWPAHGQPRMDTADQLSDDNAWRLPFVHTGEALDFRIPDCFKDKNAYPDVNRSGYIKAMYASNAMGIAKTHDLLICFGNDDPAPAMEALQADPIVLPDPNYIASTAVYGHVDAAAPLKRPLAEHRWRGGMHWLIRALQNNHSYGMWNYGDTNNTYHFKDGLIVPHYHRLWAAMHYNPARVAWWNYWRTGDSVILDFARAQTQHIIDVDTCHWTNATFAQHPDIHDARKAVGGLCDYKGVVHWHAGTRASYNAAIDYMLDAYYLTGNRRAWDVAMAHGYYTMRQPDNMFSDFGRGASGQADTLVELYKATWDPAVLQRLHWHIDRMFNSPRRNTDPRLAWAPWLGRYWDITHDPKIKDFILDWVDHDGDARVGAARLHLWAYAYYITGDEKYARHCAKEILVNAIATPVRDDEHDASVGRFLKWWYFGSTDEMIAARAAAEVKLTLADFAVREQWPTWDNWGIFTPYTLNRTMVESYFGGTYPWPEGLDVGHQMTSVIYHDGTPKDLWLGVISLEPSRDTIISAYNPSGELIRSLVRRDYDRVVMRKSAEGPQVKRVLWPKGKYPKEGDAYIVGGQRYESPRDEILWDGGPYQSPEDCYPLSGEKLTLGPNDPKGFYTIVHTGSFYTPTPILPPDDKVWIKVGKASTLTLSGFQFFWVPEDCTSFELSFLPSYQRNRFEQKLILSTGAILNPDAEPVDYIRCGLETEPQVVRIEVKPEHRGKAWCIAGNGYSIVGMKGVPSYISPSLQTFDAAPFTPQDLP